MIANLGTLPVSSINIGLAGSLVGLTAEIAKLQAELTGIASALETQLTFSSNFPPNLAGYAVQFTTAFDPTWMAALFSPANWATLNTDANADLVLQLGFVDGQLAITTPLVEGLEVGVSAGALTGWTYSGRARGFGTELTAATVNGFAGIHPDTQIDAIIIATANFASWQAFGEGFLVGTSDDEDLGASTSRERLQGMGVLNGGNWNGGVDQILSPLRIFLAELEGRKSAIEYQLEVTVGLNLPDPGEIIDFGLTLDLEAALESMVTVQTDLDLQVTGLNAKIDALFDLIFDLTVQLSAGGITVWSYSGRAGSLGAEFAPEVDDGLPGAGDASSSTYGIAIATALPSAWVDFGNITITG